jgi:hypothetical protein
MTFRMNNVKSGADAIRQAKRSVSAASQGEIRERERRARVT